MTRKSTRKYVCIVCGRVLRDAECLNTVNDGIHFTTVGNYGSAVLDMDAWVEGYICDKCFKRRADRLIVLEERDIKAERSRRAAVMKHLNDGSPLDPPLGDCEPLCIYRKVRRITFKAWMEKRNNTNAARRRRDDGEAK